MTILMNSVVWLYVIFYPRIFFKPVLQISEWCCIVMNVVTLCSGEQVMKGVQKLMI